MSDASGDPIAYGAWLLERVVGSVMHGARTLDEVIVAAGGADPVAVRDALGRAVSDGLLGESAAALADAQYERESDSVIEPSLPVAHPLDFEWRFSRRGAEYLLAKVSEQGKGDLCLIASTTVALLAASCGWQGRLVSLDSNGLVLERANRLRPQINIAHLDVTRDALPDIQASAVIADPPWYPEYIPGFLWSSAKLCAMGGHVLLIVPGEGTRPAIASERADTLRMAALFGLDVVAIEPQAIRYETPLFERNALRAAGVTPSCSFWRRGDLVVFRRTSMLEDDRPLHPPGTGTWAELSVDGMRVRFRRTTINRNVCFPQLQSIVPGDVLPTVSRRDPRRAQVDVWTSGNRVYACESPDILCTAVAAAARGSSAHEAAETFLGRKLSATEVLLVSEALDQVIKLSRMERDEQTEYAGKLSGSEAHAA